MNPEALKKDHERKIIWAHLERVYGRKPEYEDLLSEAFSRLDRALGKGQLPPSESKAWLSYIAVTVHRLRINRAKKEQRHQGEAFDDENPNLLALREYISAENEARWDAIVACLEKLDPDQREMVERVAVDGLNSTKAGEEMGLESGRAAQLALAAFQRLRRCANAHFDKFRKSL